MIRARRNFKPERGIEFSDRTHLNSKLQAELPRKAGLAPGRIIPGHGQDELTKIFGNPGSADPLRFPTPEQFKPLAMPSGIGLWSNGD